ncbi:MAG TPA: threonine/serine dehydratase [Terriglobales bacterium]|nr:threonine/serine dehydratase [Terriglobales bacterium]
MNIKDHETIRPQLQEVEEAQKLLSQYLQPTRLVNAASLSRGTRKKVYLKLETELPTASFKVRGAIYTLALNLKKRKIEEVVAHSTGNHGAAVAYAAKLLGVKARIFLPEVNNPIKRARIAGLGATLVQKGDIVDGFRLAGEYASRNGAYFLNDATDPDLPAGPATIACEILEHLPEVSSIIVPVGDTALIRGIGTAVKQISPGTRIFGVQAGLAPSYYLSWKQGRPVPTETCDTIADGLATRMPDPANVKMLQAIVDDMVLVSEQEMLDAIAALLIDEHVVAEPAGAVPAAALPKLADRCGDNIVLIVSGANISREILRRALQTD